MMVPDDSGHLSSAVDLQVLASMAPAGILKNPRVLSPTLDNTSDAQAGPNRKYFGQLPIPESLLMGLRYTLKERVFCSCRHPSPESPRKAEVENSKDKKKKQTGIQHCHMELQLGHIWVLVPPWFIWEAPRGLASLRWSSSSPVALATPP